MAIEYDAPPQSPTVSQYTEAMGLSNPNAEPVVAPIPSPHNGITHRRPLHDFKILILNEEGCYIAYLTVADVVPPDHYNSAEIMSFAELVRLKAAIAHQIGRNAVQGLVFRGNFVIHVRDDVLFKFVLKEAYHSGHEALTLVMEQGWH